MLENCLNFPECVSPCPSVCSDLDGKYNFTLPHREFTSHPHSPTLLYILLQVPGMPPMPPMPMPPMPPDMGMLQAMNMMPGGPPPPGIHMGLEPPGLPPPSLSQDDQLKMAQQRAAMVLQQEERAKQQVRRFTM